jgi:uncharacterized protein HemX
MLKAKRFLLNLAAIALLGLTIALIAQNAGTDVSATILSEHYTMNLGLLLGESAVMLGLTVALGVWAWLLVVNTEQKRTHRELERRDVSREEAQSQVKVLENKVQTLEKALSEALKSSR